MLDFKLPRSKRISEKFRVAVDFTPVLESGDTVSGQAITATNASGADVTATVLESPGYTGNVLKVTLKAGAAAGTYKVFFQATTTQGDIFIRSVDFAIVAAGA